MVSFEYDFACGKYLNIIKYLCNFQQLDKSRNKDTRQSRVTLKLQNKFHPLTIEEKNYSVKDENIDEVCEYILVLFFSYG